MFSKEVTDFVGQHIGKRINHIPRKPFYKVIVEETSFLPETACGGRRFWHIQHQTKDVPTCANDQCQEEVKWYKGHGYGQYCSVKCAKTDSKSKERTRINNREKYGVDNPIQLEGTQQKIRATNLERYGTENPLANHVIREKAKQTVRKRFGVDNVFQSEQVKKKSRQTLRERYGVDNIVHHQPTRNEIKDTNRQRYGAENPFGSKEIQEKIRKTNQERYGTHIASQQHIPETTLQRLRDKEWLLDQHHTQEKTYTKIAQELQVSPLLVSRYAYRHGIDTKQLKSSAERAVAEFVKTRYPGELTLNARGVIPPYEVDIYIPETELGIEYCGLYWHGERYRPDTHYHLTKFNLCREKGIRLIHVWENEWMTKKDIVKSRLSDLVGQGKRIDARKCRIVRVGDKTQRIFLNTNHMQGYVPATLAIGLAHGKHLLSIMTFAHRGSQKAEWKILRVCSRKGVRVINGTAKLFEDFQRRNPGASVVVHCDLRWETGQAYERLGFKLSRTSPPTPWYFNDQEHVYPSTKFQKHKLQGTLPSFNPSISTYQNMLANGYDRIWDCGNATYQYEC